MIAEVAATPRTSIREPRAMKNITDATSLKAKPVITATRTPFEQSSGGDRRWEGVGGVARHAYEPNARDGVRYKPVNHHQDRGIRARARRRVQPPAPRRRGGGRHFGFG